MVTGIVSQSGAIVIPEEIREQLHLKEGTQVSMEVEGQTLVVRSLAENLPEWLSMEGMCKGAGSLTEALMEDRAAEVAKDNARINQGR